MSDSLNSTINNFKVRNKLNDAASLDSDDEFEKLSVSPMKFQVSPVKPVNQNNFDKSKGSQRFPKVTVRKTQTPYARTDILLRIFFEIESL